MMEFMLFIGQDVPHFFGTIVAIFTVSVGLAMIIASVGFAIALARGTLDEGNNHDH